MRVQSVPAKIIVSIRWDEKAGLRRDAVRSQVIDALEAQEIKETGLLIPSVLDSYETKAGKSRRILQSGTLALVRHHAASFVSFLFGRERDNGAIW
jgi:hypothetical protein